MADEASDLHQDKIPEDRRDDLIEKVFLGELTPREAEEQARKEGLPKLAGEADPSIFNPVSEPDWTLLMTVAWIVFRDDRQVRLCANEYRTKCADFEPLERGGKTTYYLKTRDQANRSHLDITHALFVQRGRHVEMDVNHAIKELRAELRAANIIASGKRNGERHRIDALQWIDLKFFPYGKDPDTVVFENVRFESVLLPREEVIRVWPALERAKDSPVEGAAEDSGSGKRPGPKTGPRPKKTQATLIAMIKDLSEGRLNEKSLVNFTERELADRYGVGREIARKARENVLAKIRGIKRSKPTNTDQ